jgi:hypothetical protein
MLSSYASWRRSTPGGWVRPIRDGLSVSVGFLQFDPDNVLALFELKNGHTARNDLIDVNASRAGVEAFRSGNIDFEIPEIRLRDGRAKVRAAGQYQCPARTAMNGVFIDS